MSPWKCRRLQRYVAICAYILCLTGLIVQYRLYSRQGLRFATGCLPSLQTSASSRVMNRKKRQPPPPHPHVNLYKPDWVVLGSPRLTIF